MYCGTVYNNLLTKPPHARKQLFTTCFDSVVFLTWLLTGRFSEDTVRNCNNKRKVLNLQYYSNEYASILLQPDMFTLHIAMKMHIKFCEC